MNYHKKNSTQAWVFGGALWLGGLSLFSSACVIVDSDDSEGSSGGSSAGSGGSRNSSGGSGQLSGGASGGGSGGASQAGGSSGSAGSLGGNAGTSGGSAGSLGGSGGTSGNSGSGGSAAGGAGGSTADEFEAHREACLKRINDFRATEGKSALSRWKEGEACADEQAGLDANGAGAHGEFGMCGESAQNTCPGWGNLDSVIQSCLQMMWDEGPGEDFSQHGHYLNMSSTKYSQVACGFYRMQNGQIWASQNFR